MILDAEKSQMRRSSLIAAALVLSALCWATLERNELYTDEISLYGDAVDKSPRKARPLNNFGDALMKAGRHEEAGVYFERALAIAPDYPDALNNLATVYNNTGRRSEALELLLRTIELMPDHVQARNNLALTYYESDHLAEAETQFRLVIELAPESREAGFARSMLALPRSDGGFR